jgi:two-component system, OmpR family, sensor histidine kinase BaeS
MHLPRLRLAYQLSLLMAAAVVTAVVVVGILSAFNLRSGFKDYLQARDDEQLMRVVALMEQRSAKDPQLNWLRDDPDPMRSIMDAFNGRAARSSRGTEPLPPSALPPPPQEHRPPPYHADAERGRPPQGMRDDRPPPPAQRERPPPPRMNAAPPPRGDRDRLGQRLMVRDAQGQRLAGRPIPADAPRTIRAIKVDGVEVAFAELLREPEPEGLDARFLQLQTHRLLWASLVAILVAVLAAWWLAGRWSRPLVALQRATRTIASGRSAAALQPSGAREIAQLVEDVNHMAQSLERLEKARRMWIAQISHELRTPLSVLRGEMEAIEDGARQPSPEVMKRLQEEVLQLTRLVDDLHTVSVADMAGLHCTFTEGDAHAFLWRVADRFALPARQRGLRLTLPPREARPLPVRWDFGRIEQLLVNLLTNSLHYTDAPGTVAVGWHVDGVTLTLTVEDSQPAVDPQDLKELFEPLFRADRSRQRTDGHGSGLGLSIVRLIAQAHQGTAQASLSRAAGLLLTVRLRLQAGREDRTP